MFCIAFGPGKDMFDSTRIIGERQFERGKVKKTKTETQKFSLPLSLLPSLPPSFPFFLFPQDLYDSASKELTGPVQFVKVNRDFSNIIVDMNGTKVCMKGCMGVAYLSLSLSSGSYLYSCNG